MPRPDGGDRIAKVIARAGVCSRREAERLIADGRVTVDGVPLDSPAVTVAPNAKITVDGESLPAPAPLRLWRYHKPKGLITTARDPQGRPTVFDALPPELPRVLTIGRLDLSSEGLLLLTNDGAVKRRLELPSNAWVRRYRVRVHGRVEPKKLTRLAEGVRVDGIDYGPIQARLERQSGANAWLEVALKEGKNREVRRVLEHLGLTVNRLIRIAYGPFRLARLEAGQVEEVPAKVVREQLGLERSDGKKTGTAKAKPKPKPRPKSKPKPHKPGASKPAAQASKPRRAGPGKRGAKHAHRRRPA